MQIVSKEESICMKCQMLSPWENNNNNNNNNSKYDMIKLYTEHLPICLTCVKNSVLSDLRDRALVKH